MGLGRALLIGDDHGWSPLNDGIRRQSWLFEENALAASQSQTMLNALPSLCRESSVCRCGLAALVKDSNSRARQIGRRFVVDKMLIGLEQFCVFGPVESLHPTCQPHDTYAGRRMGGSGAGVRKAWCPFGHASTKCLARRPVLILPVGTLVQRSEPRCNSCDHASRLLAQKSCLPRCLLKLRALSPMS